MIRTDFGEFPLLQTERILLRPLRQDDELSIFELRSDDGVNQWLGRKKAESIEDAKNFIATISRLVDAKETLYWVLELKENGRFAGTIMLWNLDRTAAKAELGYELLPEFQGKGIMQEVLGPVLQFGFAEMGLKRIEACLSPHNDRSLRLLAKFDFVYEGELNEDGENLVIYARIKS